MSRRNPWAAGPAVPFGVSVPVGAGAVAVACLCAGVLPTPDAARLWLPALAAGAVGYAARDARAGAALAVVAFAFVDGFLENRAGLLSWHAGDAGRLGLLLAAGVLGGVLGAVAGAVEDRHAERRRFAALEAWANTGASPDVRGRVLSDGARDEAAR